MRPPDKTLMPEVLPAPRPAPVESPRTRAQRRLEELAKRAALLGAASSLSACIGYGVVDPLPPPAQQCAPDDDLSLWVFASAFGTLPVITVNLQLTQQVTGATLANSFAAVGGSVLLPARFDAATLDTSTSVAVDINVDNGATEVVLSTGLSCDGTPRAVDVHIQVPSLNITVVDAP